MRQLADGTVVAAGARQARRRRRSGYLESPTAEVQGALDAFLAATFPGLAASPVRSRWAGIEAFTDDGLPRIGEVPGVPGVLYAAGLNGHGLCLGFLLGRHLARRALGPALLRASSPTPARAPPERPAAAAIGDRCG